MSSRMDPYFETMFLLANADWDERSKDQAIEELNGFGVDGPSFYDEEFRVAEDYFSAFAKRLVPSEGVKVLEGCDEVILFTYAYIFLRNPEWIEGGKGLSAKAAAKAAEDAIGDVLDIEEKSVVDALESEDYSDQVKWQVMALLQQPKQRIGAVSRAIRENIPAFEYALSKVKAEADILLDRFDMRSRESQPSGLMRLPRKIDADTTIVPTLALPLAVFMGEKTCFYGLLIDSLADGEARGYTKTEILLGAKALSDTSKLAILMALKDASLYNLEIAERVSLTPATTSHHMGILLTAGFVEIEKRDGKAYYRISQDGIKRFLEGVGVLLAP